MSQVHAMLSIIRPLVSGTMLLLVPVLAMFFLRAGPFPLPEGGGAFDTAAFAPLSEPKQRARVAKLTAAAEDVPEVKLNVWEYTSKHHSKHR